jgi:hypothetical protein
VAGEADLRNAETYARAARQLNAIAQQVASLADAALPVAELSGIQLKNRQKSGR